MMDVRQIQIAIGGYLRLVPLPLDAAEHVPCALAERAPEERLDAIREKDDAPCEKYDAPCDAANYAKTERTTRTP